MGKRNLNLELFVVVSWMNSWVSPFIIPDIICFGFFTLDTRMVKFFMKLGVKFHSFFLEKKGEIFVPFTLFEKWKWNENDWKSRSRSESEIKMTRDRDREVKFQKKSREFSRIETLAGHCKRVTVANIGSKWNNNAGQSNLIGLIRTHKHPRSRNTMTTVGLFVPGNVWYASSLWSGWGAIIITMRRNLFLV